MEETTNNSENTFNKQEFNSFVKDALSKIETIKESYKKLFEAEEGKQSIVTEIESNLNNLKKEYENLFNNNESGVSKILEINTKLEEIKNYHKELLDGDKSIKSDIKESQDKITEFYIYLFGGENIEGEEKKIKEAIEKILTFHTDLTKEDGYQKLVEDAHKRIIDLHDELFSTGELEEESKVEKLNKEIQNISEFNTKVESEIKGFLNETKVDIETKANEINSLLSNATARTLAQGYLESMQNHGFIGLQKDLNKVIFFKWLVNITVNFLNYLLFISPLVLIGFIFVEPEFVKNFLGVSSLGGANLVGVEYVFYKISVSLPLLWISWYGQKNISHRKRLFEEYNHKLRVVQMYLLFISKENSYQLNADKMIELEEILLSIIKRNPSEVYGKDDTMLDKIIEFTKASKGITTEVVDTVQKTVSNVTE